MSALRAPRELTGRHVALILAAFFATTLLVNLSMAFLANRTWSGLLVANSYVESQRYNAVIAKGRADKALGWQVEASARRGRLELVLTDAAGEHLYPTALTAVARRAVNEVEDTPLTFARVDGSTYRAEQPLDPGAWNVSIEVSRGPETATMRIRLVVDAGP